MKQTAFVLLIFACLNGRADQVSESFGSNTYKDSSTTAVWNLALHQIHPILQATGWKVNPADTPSTTDFIVGDGSMGSFEPSTYSRFGTVNGNTITVDGTKVLQVTKFELDANSHLIAIGGPLIIESQSTVTIDGTIECSGGNASGTSGGTSYCGGGAGGAGGSDHASGTQGEPLSGSVTGGHPGTYNGVASGAGGGGGGSHVITNGSGGTDSNSPPTNTGGGGGTSSSNPQFSVNGGGAGGGGGSGSSSESGGGGGAGGGIVIIHAVGDIMISTTGKILARGGDGASTNSGGAGGGGGGGSIQLFSGGTITLTTGVPVDVSGGSAGTASDTHAGGGGAGINGRTWLVYSSFAGAGSESHPTNLDDPGVFQYSTTATGQTAISKSYDSRSTLASFQSASVSPAPSSVLSVAGSNDEFQNDDTGWLPVSQIAQMNNKRYVRFQISLANSNPTAPTVVDTVAFDYIPGQKDDFNFKSSGCGTVGPLKPPMTGGSLALLLSLQLLPLLVTWALRRRTQEVYSQE